MKPYLAFILFGYISGSIMYAYLLPKLFLNMNICERSADGNPGVANVFLNAGTGIGILVLILELFKGFFPVFLAARALNLHHPMFAFVLAAPVMGHAFPLSMKFQGGKSIAVSFGVLLGLLPIWMPVCLLAAFYLLFSLVIVICPHFYRSIVTYGFLSISALLLFETFSLTAGCFLISAIVIFKHFRRYQGEKLEIRLFSF